MERFLAGLTVGILIEQSLKISPEKLAENNVMFSVFALVAFLIYVGNMVRASTKVISDTAEDARVNAIERSANKKKTRTLTELIHQISPYEI